MDEKMKTVRIAQNPFAAASAIDESSKQAVVSDPEREGEKEGSSGI